MNKRIFVLYLCVLAGAGGIGTAQTVPSFKANYELAARFSPEKVNKMVFSKQVDPHFLKNSRRFWYAYKTPQGTFWYIVDADSGKKSLLFDNTDMASQITRIVKDPFDTQHLPIDNIRFNEKEDGFVFKVTSSLEEEKENKETGKKEKKKKEFFLQYDMQSGKVSELKEYEEPKRYPGWASVAPDTSIVVFARNFNLFYMDKENFMKALKNEKDSSIVEHRLTMDGEEYFVYGGSSNNNTNVSREENKDKRKPAYVYWAPDSKHFALIRTDERRVKDLWVINALAQPRPTLESYKYQMPGEADAPKSYLYVFDVESKTGKIIETGAFKDQTLRIYSRPKKRTMRDDIHQSNVWLGNENSFWLTRTSRDLKRIDLCRVNFTEDSVYCIVEDRLNKSLETKPPFLLEDSDEFIHWSECDGWGHLYLYDKNGDVIRQITKGDFHVDRVIGVDEKSKTVYFTANGAEVGENPYYTHLYRINLDGSGMKRLTLAGFDNQIVGDDENRRFVVNYSRVDTTPVSVLFDEKGKTIAELETADLSLLFDAGYKFPTPFTVKAADGVTDLYGVMYKPFDFDSTKRYPIICYVYPGPQTEAVNTSFSTSMDRVDRLAQVGFIVITVGNRGGHPARSKWYHTYGYGNLRDYGLADKKTAVEQLAARYPFIDISKVGIHGHSGGGFMSTAAVLVYPDFFKVAVSSAGNHENNIYNRWWSEKHHGVLETVTEAGDTTFRYSIPKNSEIAQNLKGHLMLVTGDIDNNVHPANTLRVVNALIRANKRFDMLVLPGQRHGFGDMTEYFFWRMADYFSEHLLGDGERPVDIPQMSK